MIDIHQKGAIWDNWVVDEEIGHGSYGTVYKAHRVNAFSTREQLAAVKHIPVNAAAENDDIGIGSSQIRTVWLEAQRREVSKELAAMVDLRGKPHIMSYEDHTLLQRPEGDGFDLYLRMELLTSLQAQVEKYGMPSRCEVAKLGMQIGEAIGVLEKRHYIHRDIKPANIFVDADGEYKLGDFGTARMLNSHNMATTRKGTPNYMAPEVYNGLSEYDQTVDIYSLGVVLYRLLNNNFLPFTDEDHPNTDEAMTKRVKGVPIPPPRRGDPDLNAIILRCVDFKAENRYANAQELIQDLEDYIYTHPDHEEGGGVEIHSPMPRTPWYVAYEKEQAPHTPADRFHKARGSVNHAAPVPPVRPVTGAMPPVRPVTNSMPPIPPVPSAQPERGPKPFQVNGGGHQGAFVVNTPLPQVGSDPGFAPLPVDNPGAGYQVNAGGHQGVFVVNTPLPQGGSDPGYAPLPVDNPGVGYQVNAGGHQGAFVVNTPLPQGGSDPGFAPLPVDNPGAGYQVNAAGRQGAFVVNTPLAPQPPILAHTAGAAFEAAAPVPSASEKKGISFGGKSLKDAFSRKKKKPDASAAAELGVDVWGADENEWT